MSFSNGSDVFNSISLSNNKDVFEIPASSESGNNTTISQYYVSTSDYVIGTGTITEVPELRFTPSPGKTYSVEAFINVTTTSVTNTFRWTITTTVAGDAATFVRITYSPVTTTTIQNTIDFVPVRTNVNAAPMMLESLHWGWGTFKAASSITGTAGISAIMITSGQTATIKAGSFIRVREII